jgi:hypothetical protein
MSENGNVNVTERRQETALVPAPSNRTPPRWTAVRNLEEAIQLGELVARSNTFPDVRSPAQAVVKILAGSEMGFGPFASLCDVHFIEGKASLGAHLRAAAVKGSDRYDYDVCRADAEVCDLEFWEWTGSGGTVRKGRAGWVSRGHVTYSLKEATDSGLALAKDGKSLKANWRRNPDDMLFARVISKGYRRHCPDLSGGVLAYAPEELDIEDAEVIAATPAPLQLPASHPSTPALPEQTPAVPTVQPPDAAEEPMRADQEERLDRLLRDLGISEPQFADWITRRFGDGDWRKLSAEQAARVITGLETQKEKKAGQTAGAKSG